MYTCFACSRESVLVGLAKFTCDFHGAAALQDVMSPMTGCGLRETTSHCTSLILE